MSETSMLEAIKNWLMRRGKSASSNLVIIDCGSGNIRRYIDVSYIACALDVKHNGLVTSIPGLHAFNGCDFIAAFYNQKKKKGEGAGNTLKGGHCRNIYRVLRKYDFYRKPKPNNSRRIPLLFVWHERH